MTGYENARRDTAQITSALQHADQKPNDADFSTFAGHVKSSSVCGTNSSSARETWFTPGTPPQVAMLLENYRDSARLVRLFLGEPQTGRDRMEENNIVGYVARSRGALKLPLLIAPGTCVRTLIPTAHVVRMMDANGSELYRHPKYQLPALSLELEKERAMLANGYKWTVWPDDAVRARFCDVYSAVEYVEFFTGRIAIRPQRATLALHVA